MSPTSVDAFLRHTPHRNAPGLLEDDWDELMDVPARMHLLDRWLHEDGADVTLRVHRAGTGDAGTSGPVPADGALTAISVEDAAGLLVHAIPTPSRRVGLLLADLRSTLVESGVGAFTVDGPGTRLMLRWEGWCEVLIAVDVLPGAVTGPGAPACAVAGCADPAVLDPAERERASVRIGAACAGAVLAKLLDCEGRAAFTFGWDRHGPPARDPATVRRWWAETPWARDYHDDHIGVYYDHGAGAWFGPAHLLPTREEIDGEVEVRDESLDLAGPPTGEWLLGDAMHALTPDRLRAEVSAFAEACRARRGRKPARRPDRRAVPRPASTAPPPRRPPASAP